jgi:hypothetical protein
MNRSWPLLADASAAARAFTSPIEVWTTIALAS